MMNRLGVCIVGLNGAVASTLVAGAALLRRKLTAPLALVSEPFRPILRFAGFDEMVFAGWDPRGETSLAAARRNRVLDAARLAPVAKELARLTPWPAPGGRAAPHPNGSAGASPSNVSSACHNIEKFRRQHKLDTVVVLNLLPTGENTASQTYALAAAKTGCPFINFTPNDCAEDRLTEIPFCGRDGKTGQTWFKSVLAPALHARGLRVTGWFSTNLLGNEDGKIVGDPVKGKQKIRDKSRLLGEMLGYEPFHQVQIHYYPPRGDNKESWDNIDFEGFLGLPMQIKVNALYRDSILAAPMCLDLCRFMELAHRRGERGPQEWLSFFFKSPYARNAKTLPPHDAAIQERMLREFLSHR